MDPGTDEVTGAPRGGPEAVAAPLSSLATALAELTARLSSIAEALAQASDEELASGLFEVERSLVAAGRRLDKVVDDLGAQHGPGPQRRRP